MTERLGAVFFDKAELSMSSKYPFHEEVQKYFPDFDYTKPAGDPNVLCDMSHPENKVGHQQRAFSVFWALKQCGPLDLGLDLGSHRGLTPYCIHVDRYYDNANEHPFYGGKAPADVIADANSLSAFPSNTFPLVMSSHSLEHMGTTGDDKDIAHLLAAHWVRVLRPGGVLAMIIPDNDAFDVLPSDKDHKHAWGASDFEARILDRVSDLVEVVEFNTFKNMFSFDVVLRKR